jgi:lipoprotein NlpD
VQPGQTLYRIARAYEVDEAHLARVNQISDPKQLRASQKLFIPGVTRLRNVPSTAATAAAVTAPLSAAPPPPAAQKKPVAEISKPTDPKSVAVKPVVTAKPAEGIFNWPARGKLLNKFGTYGQKSYKGIEIGIPTGTDVFAAASGKVIYSGNAIPGYGNLVILEHSDGYFTVYGYNQKCLVKRDDHVGQGDRVALSGSPPSGESARLHFEIRKGKSAVDPILYLP